MKFPTKTAEDPSLASTADIVVDLDAMVGSLTIALGIGSDRSLQNRLRKISGAAEGKPFAVSQLHSPGWLEIENGRTKSKRKPTDGIPSIDLDDAMERDSDLASAVEAAALKQSVMRQATQMLAPLLKTPSRHQFRTLFDSAPLLEHLAYSAATRIASLLDVLRPDVIADVSAGTPARRKLAIKSYWSSMHTMANMYLLASDPEAGAWLTDMAKQLAWKVWTPSFPLVRERTVWMAACAARSVIAFGEGVVENYLTALSTAEHSMKAFDALYGLTAIALAIPHSARPLEKELRSLRAILDRREVQDRSYFELAYEDAITLIAGSFGSQDSPPEYAALGWDKKPGRGLATRAAFCQDPAAIMPSRRLLGFIALPRIIATRPEDFFSVANSAHGVASEFDMANTIMHAWSPSRARDRSGATIH